MLMILIMTAIVMHVAGEKPNLNELFWMVIIMFFAAELEIYFVSSRTPKRN